MIKQKEKQSICLWKELNVHHLKNRIFFFLTLGRQPCPFATTKQEPLLKQTKGDPGKFPSVLRTATQQVRLCPQDLLNTYNSISQKHIYLQLWINMTFPFCFEQGTYHLTKSKGYFFIPQILDTNLHCVFNFSHYHQVLAYASSQYLFINNCF